MFQLRESFSSGTRGALPFGAGGALDVQSSYWAGRSLAVFDGFGDDVTDLAVKGHIDTPPRMRTGTWIVDGVEVQFAVAVVTGISAALVMMMVLGRTVLGTDHASAHSSTGASATSTDRVY